VTIALGRTADELTVGDRASITKLVSETDIYLYVGMTGDLNPLYTDEDYAATHRYGGRIAPGALTTALVISVVSTKLPGPGTILERENLHFTAPVRPGDTVTAFAEVVEVIPSRGRARLGTVCKNQDGVVVLEGEVVVLPPPPPRSATARPRGRG
jgi:3-hydroxybutyryl-CoA dehydratase